MRAVVVLGCAMLLGGCLSNIAKNEAAQDDRYCASIGTKAGSDAYAQCRLQLRGERARQEAAARENPPFQPYRITAPGSNRLDCTSRGEFGQVRTTCN